MLSDRNVRKINDQIANELRTVGGAFTSAVDKAAALDRIAKLQALLTPQPSREDILTELAAAIVDETKKPHQPSPTALAIETLITRLAR